MNYRITLAYDGTEYAGLQLQVGHSTVQGAVNAALEKLERAPVIFHAAGRTDAGVHAAGQVISFHLSKEWSEPELVRALNGNLPSDIRALSAERATDDFNARFHAKAKIYRYQISTTAVLSPFLLRYAWHYPYSLDLERMRTEVESLIGTHDFTAFTVTDCETRTNIRTVSEARIESDGELISLFFTGNGFLRYQVRTMVSALAELNRGRLRVGSMAELIASRDRGLIGVAAPAKGLTLMKVKYSASAQKQPSLEGLG